MWQWANYDIIIHTVGWIPQAIFYRNLVSFLCAYCTSNHEYTLFVSYRTLSSGFLTTAFPLRSEFLSQSDFLPNFTPYWFTIMFCSSKWLRPRDPEWGVVLLGQTLACHENVLIIAGALSYSTWKILARKRRKIIERYNYIIPMEGRYSLVQVVAVVVVALSLSISVESITVPTC